MSFICFHKCSLYEVEAFDMMNCNTPVFTSFALKIHDTHIVNNLGAELKAKAHHQFGYVVFLFWEWSPIVYHDVWNIFNCGIM